MKLTKNKNKDNGYDIILTIANREYSSYWSEAPKSIDNVDLSYLQDKYPQINTLAKMNEFKSLYKNLWINVSEEQLKIMTHCLGLNYKNKPYRNYYSTHHEDKDWNDLIKKGLAIKSRNNPNRFGCTYFWLTKQGVEYVLGKSVRKKFYDDL